MAAEDDKTTVEVSDGGEQPAKKGGSKLVPIIGVGVVALVLGIALLSTLGSGGQREVLALVLTNWVLVAAAAVRYNLETQIPVEPVTAEEP